MSARAEISLPTAPSRDRRAAPKSEARYRARRIAGRSAGYVTLILLSAATAFPLLWMLITSIRDRQTVFGGSVIPDEVTFDAYRQAWTQLNFAAHFLTSTVITVMTVLGVVLLATLAAYAFAHLRFPGRQVIYVVLLSTLMLPVMALIIPLFLQLDTLNLLNTREGLVLAYIGTSLPFAMFLMRAFFETLPTELAEAGRVDGANEFTIFWRIMLPMAAPGVATIVIIQFMITWNEFIFAQTFLQSPDLLPLQPVLFSVVGEYGTNWPVLCASLTMSVLPIILVYVRMQRRFVAGIALGAVKY